MTKIGMNWSQVQNQISQVEIMVKQSKEAKDKFIREQLQAKRNQELMEEFKEYNWQAARYGRPNLTFEQFVAKRETGDSSNARHVVGTIYGGLVGQKQEVIATWTDGSLEDSVGKKPSAPQSASKVVTIDDVLDQVKANEQAFYDFLKSS